MQIALNGADHSVVEHCSVAQLLEQLGLAEKRLAVELNGQIISRSQHAHTILGADDQLEIVHAIGGGSVP